jgi:hypothetical protein
MIEDEYKFKNLWLLGCLEKQELPMLYNALWGIYTVRHLLLSEFVPYTMTLFLWHEFFVQRKLDLSYLLCHKTSRKYVAPSK